MGLPIGDATARTALITGTGGLGYEAAVALASRGLSIIFAGRDALKGEAACAKLASVVPNCHVRFELLDLASLASVRGLSERLMAQKQYINILINNAGIMSPPQRELTADGYELQFGVNYLGHFALTAGLLPLLSEQARVVNVTSLAQHYAKLNLNDLQGERRYHPARAYCSSKLLQAIFAIELQRRSDAYGWGVTSLSAHPGSAATNLFSMGRPSIGSLLAAKLIGPLFGQSASDGARSLVHAAVAPEVTGGEMYGPSGLFQMKGPPALARYAPTVRDEQLAADIWVTSARLAGVSFPDSP